MRGHLLRAAFAVLAIAAVFAAATVETDARARFGAGSRGMRTFSAPPPTATAPRGARPIERTVTQPGQPAAGVARSAPAAAGGSFFNRPGFLGGLAAGFLGAGLFGLLFGHGLAGGLGGMASFLGLLLQVVLVIVVARLAWSWWQRRSEPAFAGGPSLRRSVAEGPRPDLRLGGYGGSGGSASDAAGAPIELQADDFNTFERLLGEIQTAFSAEDLNALRTHATPEMVSQFADQLAHNASHGGVNKISDVKLLQGDLAEAWREDDDEYATVAMRYSLSDRIVERAGGRVLEELPSEATELWTFRRARGGNWLLSAIQQTDE